MYDVNNEVKQEFQSLFVLYSLLSWRHHEVDLGKVHAYWLWQECL